MRKYNEGFYSLMDEAGILSSKSFDLYIKDVIGFGNSQALNLDGFSFEPTMQMEFDYEQLQVENNIKVMATYTDKDSEAIPFGSKGFETSRGVIPRQKARFLMDEDEYRKYLIAVTQMDFQNMTAKEYALNILFNKMTDIRDAHDTSMTYQRDQMVSAGGVTLDTDNNPRGIKGVTFSASIPKENITTLTSNKRWFTDSEKKTEGTESDPVGDIMKIIRMMKRKGYNNITIEVDEVSFYDDMNHSKWQTKIGYALTPSLILAADNDANARMVGANATFEEQKRAFEKITGCTVKYKQGLVGVEKLNSSSKKLERVAFRSFKENTYVFYPTGPLGTIKVVAPLLPDSTHLYGRILGGKGIIQYEYDAKSKTQDWWSELTALCVPNRSAEMFYLYTK